MRVVGRRWLGHSHIAQRPGEWRLVPPGTPGDGRIARAIEAQAGQRRGVPTGAAAREAVVAAAGEDGRDRGDGTEGRGASAASRNGGAAASGGWVGDRVANEG